MECIVTPHIALPKLGLGTWRLSGSAGVGAVARAVSLGYRHIDTARMYRNEAEVGAGIAASGVPRAEIFLTTKLWLDELRPEQIRVAVADSLAQLETSYVDLLLIHWPSREVELATSLKALLRQQEAGKARAIGVSNFPVALMREAVERIGATIAVNQIEYHVLLSQEPVLLYARDHAIAVTAYCPLAQGRLGDFPGLAPIAAKHRASTAQIALAWLFGQEMVAAIPKAAREESLRANLAALAIRLDEEDRRLIAALPKNRRFVDPEWRPAWDRTA